jgi:hypothetical protein
MVHIVYNQQKELRINLNLLRRDGKDFNILESPKEEK